MRTSAVMATGAGTHGDVRWDLLVRFCLRTKYIMDASWMRGCAGQVGAPGTAAPVPATIAAAVAAVRRCGRAYGWPKPFDSWVTKTM